MLLNKCKECIFRNKCYFLTYRSIFLKSFWIVPNGGTTEHLNLTASNSKIMRKKRNESRPKNTALSVEDVSTRIPHSNYVITNVAEQKRECSTAETGDTRSKHLIRRLEKERERERCPFTDTFKSKECSAVRLPHTVRTAGECVSSDGGRGKY